jgi:hypothetical protein
MPGPVSDIYLMTGRMCRRGAMRTARSVIDLASRETDWLEFFDRH